MIWLKRHWRHGASFLDLENFSREYAFLVKEEKKEISKLKNLIHLFQISYFTDQTFILFDYSQRAKNFEMLIKRATHITVIAILWKVFLMLIEEVHGALFLLFVHLFEGF